MSEQIDALRRDMFHGTAETHRLDHPDALARVDAVMTQAANVQPAGALFRMRGEGSSAQHDYVTHAGFQSAVEQDGG